MATVTFKSVLAEGWPYRHLSVPDYLTYLNHYKDDLYTGKRAIYLAREVDVDNQKLYFPFLDVDGDVSLEGDDKIQSAIGNTALTYRILKKLGVASRFAIVATGHTGFRMASNMLLSRIAHLAFVDFVKGELGHITDTTPTEEVHMPHQLFAWKGSFSHNHKELVNRHSSVIPGHLLEQRMMTVDLYKDYTAGRPDPELIIDFMERFLDFAVITDLHALGNFGKKLLDYTVIRQDLKLDSLRIGALHRTTPNVAPDVLREMLEEKGILCKVEKRGSRPAISFTGLPCPACHKTTAHARAYAPHYRLKCFNVNCPAHHGLPLIAWAGLSAAISSSRPRPESYFHLGLPTEFHTRQDAQSSVRSNLLSSESVLFAQTPGVGKTYVALETLAPLREHLLVLYSCFNKRLQTEAYTKMVELTQGGNIYKLQSLEDACLRKEELQKIVGAGYSPAELLCSGCMERGDCDYHRQRTTISKGIYFVTHHMLRFLEKTFPTPDYIVLDEDLVKGFLLRDECTEDAMRSLATVLTDDRDYLVVKKILDIGQAIATQWRRDKHAISILVNARNFSGEENKSVLTLLASQFETTESEIFGKIRRVVNILNGFRDAELYEKGVNLKAVTWIKGILRDTCFPYVAIEKDGSIHFYMKYTTPLGYAGTPVKILDATGDKKVVKSLLGREVVLSGSDIEWRSKRTHLKISISREGLRKAKVKDLERLLRKALEPIKKDSILVLTYQAELGRIVRLCQRLEPNKSFKGYHFMGPRGINDYLDCDAVLCLGLPYPNLDSSWQDAHILFPSSADVDLRETWPEANMLWELLQTIHRTRPVLKNGVENCVEMVIVAPYWPSILPEPDSPPVDLSKNLHWKELAMQRLKPYVNEFGFLNQDIGFMANVYVKSKESSAHSFRRKLVEFIRSILQRTISENDDVFQKLATMSESEVYDLISKEPMRMKLMFGLLKHITNNYLPYRILNLLRLHSSKLESDLISDDPITLSNTNEWAELLNEFTAKYPPFESFRIRLPHARSNVVPGRGLQNRVTAFYRDLSQLGPFREIDTGSYETIEPTFYEDEPVPPGFITLYVPDGDDRHVYLGSQDGFYALPLELTLKAFQHLIYKEGTKVVTNAGKLLAKHILTSGLPRCEIEDVLLYEQIIRNSDEGLDGMKLESLFKRYQLPHNAPADMKSSQLYKVWLSQSTLIKEYGLTNIVELEKKILWITARMELRGIGVDIDRMRTYKASLEGRLDDSKLKKEYDAINRYLRLIGLNERIHEDIRQIGTKTGRFNRDLQTARREGPVRSFFKAGEGYTFIMADYASQEPSIAAGLAHDETLIAMFKSHHDVYLELESMITGKSIETCGGLRQAMKTILVGLLYGRSSYSIHQQLTEDDGLQFTLKQVESLIDKVRVRLGTVLNWIHEKASKAREDGFISAVTGRRMAVSTDTKITTLYNYPIQGTAADGLKLALILLDEKLQGLDAYPVLTLHDEIIVEARDDIVDEVTDILEECMKEAFGRLVPNVPFEVKVEIRDTWGR